MRSVPSTSIVNVPLASGDAEPQPGLVAPGVGPGTVSAVSSALVVATDSLKSPPEAGGGGEVVGVAEGGTPGLGVVAAGGVTGLGPGVTVAGGAGGAAVAEVAGDCDEVMVVGSCEPFDGEDAPGGVAASSGAWVFESPPVELHAVETHIGTRDPKATVEFARNR